MPRPSHEPSTEAPSGVSLPRGTSGSRLLAELLGEAVAAFPAALGSVEVPRGATFKKAYADVLARFECARAASQERAAIARSLARRQLERFEVHGPDGREPLLEHLARPAEPFALMTGTGALAPEPVVAVPYAGRTHRGRELPALAADLVARHGATHAAARALGWIAAEADDAGRLDLGGHTFAVLGAAAEIAPTELLVRAGARVVWIDVQEPPEALRRANVSWVPGGADLLAAPARIASTLDAVAAGSPIHLGLFAYAPGRAREWRLATAMNGIVHRMDPRHVGSLAMFLSPTTPAVVQPEDLEATRTRREGAKPWQTALARGGLLPEPHVRSGGTTVVRSIVPVQGTTYQAAQYAAKLLAAEAFAVHGTRLDAEHPRPVTVSANVAPITRTRSLRHPLFEAAFLGAPRFGVEIFDPSTTRALAALLMLHDVLNPSAPASGVRGAERTSDTFAQQVHGGIFGMPWKVDAAISAAAVLGLGRRPKLLLRMFR